jgi:hypothetical protein
MLKKCPGMIPDHPISTFYVLVYNKTVGQKKNGTNFVRSYLPELLTFLND